MSAYRGMTHAVAIANVVSGIGPSAASTRVDGRRRLAARLD